MLEIPTKVKRRNKQSLGEAVGSSLLPPLGPTSHSGFGQATVGGEGGKEEKGGTELFLRGQESLTTCVLTGLVWARVHLFAPPIVNYWCLMYWGGDPGAILGWAAGRQSEGRVWKLTSDLGSGEKELGPQALPWGGPYREALQSRIPRTLFQGVGSAASFNRVQASLSLSPSGPLM